MYNLATNGYSHDEVKKALKGNRQIAFRYELLDKYDKTIGDVNATGYIDFNSETSIMRVANFEIAEMKDIDYIDERIKPYLRLRISSEWIEYPLGVFLMNSPCRKSDGYSVKREVDCYDKSIILKDDKFTTRYKVPSGTYYTNAISTILSDTGITNYQIEQSNLQLQTDIEYEIGTSKLDVINSLLKAINYNNLYVDANGCFKCTKYLQPDERMVDDYYETDKNSIIMTGAEESLDVFNCPNKIVRYLENAELGCLISVATNDDITSKLSIQQRGRTIVDIEAVSDIADQATLDAYTQRIANEKKIYHQIIFSSALMPHHEYLDCLYIKNKELNTEGKYIETAWNMELTVGGAMKHTCKRAVSI